MFLHSLLQNAILQQVGHPTGAINLNHNIIHIFFDDYKQKTFRNNDGNVFQNIQEEGKLHMEALQWGYLQFQRLLELLQIFPIPLLVWYKFYSKHSDVLGDFYRKHLAELSKTNINNKLDFIKKNVTFLKLFTNLFVILFHIFFQVSKGSFIILQ